MEQSMSIVQVLYAKNNGAKFVYCTSENLFQSKVQIKEKKIGISFMTSLILRNKIFLIFLLQVRCLKIAEVR
jgi:hypothetical protein